MTIGRYRIRLRELALLLFAGAITLGGFTLLSLVRNQHVVQADLRFPLYYVVSTLLLSIWMGWFAPRADELVLPVVAAITGIGLLVVSRLNPDLGNKQIFWVLLAETLAAVVVAFPARVSTLRVYKYSWASLGLFLIALTIVAGTDINGSGYRRWIGFRGFYLQPVELLKVLMAIFFSAYLEEKHELLSAARLRLAGLRLPPFQYLAPLVVMWGLSLALLVKQNDLGSALLFLGIFLAMIYVGTARTVYPITGLIMFAAGVFAAFQLFPHVRDRTLVWLDPFSRASGSGFQLVQGLIALASGGIGGQGIGQGAPYKVPVVTTDFILAAIGEELGLAGVAVLLALMLFLVFRGLTIAIQSTDNFQKLLATGLVATIGIQTLVIVGGTTRLMPLTGVPLPFVSYGGSSTLANYLIIGLLLKISSEVRRPT